MTHFAYNNAGTLERYLSGTLDNVAIFDKSLTQTDIENDYDEPPWV